MVSVDYLPRICDTVETCTVFDHPCDPCAVATHATSNLAVGDVHRAAGDGAAASLRAGVWGAAAASHRGRPITELQRVQTRA